MIISFHYGIYFSQQKHGEIVGGIGDPEEPSSYNIKSSLKFVERFTDVLGMIVPAFKNLNIVRQWAGFYDVTPDAQPNLGFTEGVDTFIQANGYSGHGFMIAPKVTELMWRLGQIGVNVRPDILTMDDACLELSSLLKIAAAGCSSPREDTGS